MLENLFFCFLLFLQVPYIPASKAQVDNVMTLLKGRNGGLVDLGSGDGRIVSINRIFGGKKTVLAAVQVLDCSYFNPKGAGSQ